MRKNALKAPADCFHLAVGACAILCVCAMLNGCGASESENATKEVIEEYVAEENIISSEDEMDSDDGEAAADEDEVEDEETARDRDLTVYGPDYSADTLSYIELNFYINGIKYTLGETILQDLIDDGVEFTESYEDICSTIPAATTYEVTAVITNTVKLRITVADDTGYQHYVNELKVVEISCSDIEYIFNDELFFDFQIDLNHAAFLEKYGEPAEETEMNTGVYLTEYKEKTATSRSYGCYTYNSGYSLSFSANGDEKLCSVNMYVPF